MSRIYEAVLSSAYHYPGSSFFHLSWMVSEFQLHNCRTAAKILEFGFARECVHSLHAGVRSPKTSSTSGTVLQHLATATLWMNVANSCKLGFFSQCFKVLHTFSQSVPSWGLIVPWCFQQRIYFLRFHFFQYLLIFLFS